MRIAGMIGGLGPESTIDYYRSILARYRARKPDGEYPQIVINSLDVDKGIAMLDAGRLGQLANYLVTGVHNPAPSPQPATMFRIAHGHPRQDLTGTQSIANVLGVVGSVS